MTRHYQIPMNPLKLPPNWREMPAPAPLAQLGAPCAAYYRDDGALTVLATEEPHNGTKWLHISISCPRRPPTWDEIKFCKRTFMGDVVAVMILPQEADYVNIHPYCFHLYHRIDGDTVPGNPQKG